MLHFDLVSLTPCQHMAHYCMQSRVMELERSPRIRDSTASGNRLRGNEDSVGIVSAIVDQHGHRMHYILYEPSSLSLPKTVACPARCI